MYIYIITYSSTFLKPFYTRITGIKTDLKQEHVKIVFFLTFCQSPRSVATCCGVLANTASVARLAVWCNLVFVNPLRSKLIMSLKSVFLSALRSITMPAVPLQTSRIHTSACWRKAEDRKEMLASLPAKDEGTVGEKTVDIDTLINRLEFNFTFVNSLEFN